MSNKQRNMSMTQRVGYISLIAAIITIISFLLSLDYKPPGGTREPNIDGISVYVNTAPVVSDDETKSCEPQPQREP